MSTVLITGGTGTLGSKLTPILAARGHEVRVLSRRPGRGTHVGDLTTGDGLAAAAAGADLVVHAASDTRPARLGQADQQQTSTLLADILDCRHLLYISIVGIDAIPFRYYQAKLAWYARLAHWLNTLADPAEPLVLGGDFNVAPEDKDVWDPEACHGGTHVSPPERDAFLRLCRWGLVDAYRLHRAEPGRYTWWDYRAGAFHKNFGMRIDHLLVTRPLAERAVWAEIDREARKGKPIPSDHAPLVIDLDRPGHPFEAGWAAAEARIAARGTRLASPDSSGQRS